MKALNEYYELRPFSVRVNGDIIGEIYFDTIILGDWMYWLISSHIYLDNGTNKLYTTRFYGLQTASVEFLKDYKKMYGE
jgi:hypothetical protein